MPDSATDEHLTEVHDATIDYCVLEGGDLQQVHDLLERIFWDGIKGSVHDINSVI